MLYGYLPKFQNVQPCVKWAVVALAEVNLYVPLLGVAVEGASVDSEKLAGLGDGVSS